MKTIFNLALVSIVLLAACKKTEMQTISPRTNGSSGMSTKANLSSNPNGSAGIIQVYYDGNLFNMNSKLFTDQPASTILAHNKSINILYESDGFVTVTDAIQGEGPGYNALWREVDIVFNTGFTPHQFLSDTDILAAASGSNPEITLAPTNEIYRCDILQHNKVQ